MHGRKDHELFFFPLRVGDLDWQEETLLLSRTLCVWKMLLRKMTWSHRERMERIIQAHFRDSCESGSAVWLSAKKGLGQWLKKNALSIMQECDPCAVLFSTSWYCSPHLFRRKEWATKESSKQPPKTARLVAWPPSMSPLFHFAEREEMTRRTQLERRVGNWYWRNQFEPEIPERLRKTFKNAMWFHNYNEYFLAKYVFQPTCAKICQ